MNPYRFAIAGMCGIVSLLMMLCGFYGVFLRMKRKQSVFAKPFLLSAILFVAVGTMYHNVFAITSFIYNRLSNAGYGDAKSLSLEVFNVFIFVGALAAVGYGIMVLLMFIDSVKGRIYPFKWMWCINPFVFMIISIVLSKMLPQNAFTNGVFCLGQQSIGLFIVFVVLCFTTEEM